MAKSWGGINKVSKDEMFKSTKEYNRKRGLKVGVWGAPETGKTHFVCSCPKPVYIIDTEFGSYPVARKFDDEEINIADVVVLNEKTDDVDFIKSLDNIEQAVKVLSDVREGTIAIDSGSDVWQWIGAWLEKTARRRSKKTGQMLQMEWGRGNERYRNMMLKLLSKEVNFVLTTQEKPSYSADGKQTGVVPNWQKQTPYWLDMVIRTTKEVTRGQTSYNAYVEKFRYSRMANLMLKDNTFEAVKKVIREEYKIDDLI